MFLNNVDFLTPMKGASPDKKIYKITPHCHMSDFVEN